MAVSLAEIEQRFLDATRARLRPSTQAEYLMSFRRFAKASRLGDLTRRQLAGPRGKQLILEHLAQLSKPSWLTELSCIRSVWCNGLRLPWPIDTKVDIGRLPRTRREPTPSDELVKEWADALTREKDPYLRLLWLLIAQHGWRPSHATGARWGDLQRDPSGRLRAILMTGERGEFKTYAPVAVRLAPDVVRALEDWQRLHPAPHPEAWVLPWRSAKGQVCASRRMDKDTYRRHWLWLRKKYDLPALRPKDLRHWVSTACRKAGLSKVATAYLQGHDATQGGAMRDWYDNPRVEEVLEEQENCLPKGPLALLVPSEVELVSGAPSEAVVLLEAYLAGEVGTMEFMTSIEHIRRKGAPRPSV
jgi:integrase